MRIFRHIPVGLLGLLLTLVPTPGYGQATGTQAQFKSLVQQARQARDVGDYAKAIELLESAYAVSPKPVLLNNIGKACEELGWYDKAVDAYKRVANDPKADPGIRTLDEARIGKLGPLLEQGWISVSAEAAKRGVWVNGTPYRAGVRGDFAVPPGPASVEMTADDGKTLLLLPIDMPAGRRVTVKSAEVPTNLGQLAVPDGAARPSSITVDGYQLRGYTLKVERLALPSGPHRFLLAGAKPGVMARVTAQLAPGAMDGTLFAEAEYTGGESTLAMGPIAGIVLGLGAVGFGAWQWAQVSSDRDALKADLLDRFSTERNAAEIQASLDEENDTLSSRHTLGSLALAPDRRLEARAAGGPRGGHAARRGGGPI